MSIGTKKIYVNILLIILYTIIMSFSLSSIITSIFFSLDTIAPYDTAYIMPAKACYNGFFYTVSQLLFVSVVNNYYQSLIISGLVIIVTFFFLMMLLKKTHMEKNFKITKLFAFTIIMTVFFGVRSIDLLMPIIYLFSINIRYDIILVIITIMLFFPGCIFILASYLTSLPNELKKKQIILNSFTVVFLTIYFCFTYYLDYSAKRITNEPKPIVSKADCEFKKTEYIAISENKRIFLTNKFGGKNFCNQNKIEAMKYIKNNRLSSFTDELYRDITAFYTLNNDLDSLITYFIDEYKEDFDVNAANNLFKLTINKANVVSLQKYQDKLLQDKNIYTSPMALFFRDYNHIKNKIIRDNSTSKIDIPTGYNDYSKYFIYHPGRDWMKGLLKSRINSKIVYGRVLLNKHGYSNRRVLLINLSNNLFKTKDNLSLLNKLSYNIVDTTKTSSNGDFILKSNSYTDQELLIEVNRGYKLVASKDIQELINATKVQKVNLGKIQLKK